MSDTYDASRGSAVTLAEAAATIGKRARLNLSGEIVECGQSANGVFVKFRIDSRWGFAQDTFVMDLDPLEVDRGSISMTGTVDPVTDAKRIDAIIEKLRGNYTEAGVWTWLGGRHSSLEGDRPVELLANGDISRVEAAVPPSRSGGDMTLTISRKELVRIIDEAIPANLAARSKWCLREVARTADAVAVGSFRLHDVGCPKTQAQVDVPEFMLPYDTAMRNRFGRSFAAGHGPFVVTVDPESESA
jgi:hypothetical protein